MMSQSGASLSAHRLQHDVYGRIVVGSAVFIYSLTAAANTHILEDMVASY